MGTVEVGVARGVDKFDVFDGFGGSLVAVSFEFFLALGPVGVFVDLAGYACSFFNVHVEFIVDNRNISKLEVKLAFKLL